MTKLAETYFRLAIRLEQEDRDRFQHHLQSDATLHAKHLFRQETRIEVTVEDGSIRGWVRVAGRLFVAATTTYGAIRAGMDAGVHDARFFSEQLRLELQNSGISDSEIARFERRLGVPGRLSRLFHEMDYLQAHGHDLSKGEYQQHIGRLTQDFEKTLRQIEEAEDAKLIRNALPKEIQSQLQHSVLPPVNLPALQGRASSTRLVPFSLQSQLGHAIHQPALPPVLGGAETPIALRPEDLSFEHQESIEPRVRWDRSRKDRLYRFSETDHGFQLSPVEEPPE